MCTQAIIGDTPCINVGELKEALGQVVFCDGYAGLNDPRECLCSVDHQKTAAAAGMRLVLDDPLWIEYVKDTP